MTADVATDIARLFVGLLGAAVVVALVARRLELPYTVALVVFGIALGSVDRSRAVEIGPQLVLSVFLPGLVFEAALRTGVDELRRTLAGVALLAAPGVLIGALLVAVVLAAATGLPVGLGFVLGAMVAPTDPAAVIATFKRLRAPRLLATLIEAESLLNDGTGIVLFSIAVEALSRPVTPVEGIASFVLIVALSAATGAAFGLLGWWVTARTDDHLVELSITIVVAYGTYLAADWVHLSGVVATVTAGVLLGTLGRRHGMTRRTLELLEDTWELIGFLLTAFVFLLVGLVISTQELLAQLVPIAWTVTAMVAARALVVYLLLGGLSRGLRSGRSFGAERDAGGVEAGRRASLAFVPGLPMTWLHVTFWSGLRGAVAVALALSLPLDVPQRPVLQAICFGAVLFTLVVQGTTAGLLVTRLGLTRVPSRASTPSGEASAPAGEASAPAGEASAPSGEASAPSGEASAPSGDR